MANATQVLSDFKGDHLSIKMFGGKPDGATDNGPAFRAAMAYLAARGGGDLHIPRGYNSAGTASPYMISSKDPVNTSPTSFIFAVYIPANVRIHGKGTIKLGNNVNDHIDAALPYGLNLFTNAARATHIEIEGITIDMNGGLNLQPAHTIGSDVHPQYAFKFFSSAAAPSSYITIRNGVKIINSSGNGMVSIEGASGHHASIENCKFLVGGQGMQAAGTVNVSGTAVTAVGNPVLFQPNIAVALPHGWCRINNVWYAIASRNSSTSLTLVSPGAGTQTGVPFTASINTYNPDFTFVYSEWSETSVNNCVIWNDPANSGASGGVELHNRNSSVTNCNIKSCFPGVWMVSVPGSMVNCEVSNNIMTDMYGGIGLWASSNGVDSNGLPNNSFGDSLVTGNQITLTYNKALADKFGGGDGIFEPITGPVSKSAGNSWTTPAGTASVLISGLTISNNIIRFDTRVPNDSNQNGMTFAGLYDVHITNNKILYMPAYGMAFFGSPYDLEQVYIEGNYVRDFGNNTTPNNHAALLFELTDLNPGVSPAMVCHAREIYIRRNRWIRSALSGSGPRQYGIVGTWDAARVTNFVSEDNRGVNIDEEMTGGQSIVDVDHGVIRHLARQGTALTPPTLGAWSKGDIVWAYNPGYSQYISPSNPGVPGPLLWYATRDHVADPTAWNALEPPRFTEVSTNIFGTGNGPRTRFSGAGGLGLESCSDCWGDGLGYKWTWGTQPNAVAVPISAATDIPANSGHAKVWGNGGAITSSVGSIGHDVPSASFGTPPFIVRIDFEEILVTNDVSNTFLGCIRGANGTLAAPHNDVADIYGMVDNLCMITTPNPHGLDSRSYVLISGVGPIPVDGAHSITVFNATKFMLNFSPGSAPYTLSSTPTFLRYNLGLFVKRYVWTDDGNGLTMYDNATPPVAQLTLNANLKQIGLGPAGIRYDTVSSSLQLSLDTSSPANWVSLGSEIELSAGFGRLPLSAQNLHLAAGGSGVNAASAVWGDGSGKLLVIGTKLTSGSPAVSTFGNRYTLADDGTGINFYDSASALVMSINPNAKQVDYGPGSVRYNVASSKLQYSHDRSTWTPMGTATQIELSTGITVVPIALGNLTMGAGGATPNAATAIWGNNTGWLWIWQTNVSGVGKNRYTFADDGTGINLYDGATTPAVQLSLNPGAKRIGIGSGGLQYSGGFIQLSHDLSTWKSLKFPFSTDIGGTGNASLGASYSVAYVNAAANSLVYTGAGTTGDVLKGNTGGAPTFGPVAITATTLVYGTAYASLSALAAALAADTAFTSAFAHHPHTHTGTYLQPTTGSSAPLILSPDA